VSLGLGGSQNPAEVVAHGLVSPSCVVIPEPPDHQVALAIFGEQVVGDAVAPAGRSDAVEWNRVLSVEVHRRLVAVEVIEHWRQRLAPIEHLRGFRALPVHVHDELGVVCEERLLSFGIASVGAMNVDIYELADREAVGLLSRRDRCVDHR
jgi:hypothetical protein